MRGMLVQPEIILGPADGQYVAHPRGLMHPSGSPAAFGLFLYAYYVAVPFAWVIEQRVAAAQAARHVHVYVGPWFEGRHVRAVERAQIEQKHALGGVGDGMNASVNHVSLCAGSVRGKSTRFDGIPDSFHRVELHVVKLPVHLFDFPEID